MPAGRRSRAGATGPVPAAEAANAGVTPQGARPEPRSFKVWVVDPDPAIQGSVSWLLRHLPVEVETYRFGEDFLRQSDLSSPGCVLVDTDLPDTSGLDVLRAVQRRTDGAITVIVLASSPDVHLAVQALREGAADFFEKPFLGAALTRRVERALAESQRDPD